MSSASSLWIALLAAPLAWGGAIGYCSPTQMDIRLETYLSSLGSPAGTPLRAVVIGPVEVGSRVLIPQGSLVYGTVRRSISVGWGLRRERASMDLEFREYELPDGRRFPLQASLRSVD